MSEPNVSLTRNELGLILNWMYRAQASGPAASQIMRKLQEARKILKEAEEATED
jgi:hypothetical protein